jgi:hypothetical protein
MRAWPRTPVLPGATLAGALSAFRDVPRLAAASARLKKLAIIKVPEGNEAGDGGGLSATAFDAIAETLPRGRELRRRYQANDRRAGVNFSWGATRRSSPIPRRPRAFPRADEARQMIEGFPLDPAADGTVLHCRFASMLRRRLGRGGSAQSAWVSPSVASANGEPLSPFRMFWRASKKYRGRLSEKSAID